VRSKSAWDTARINHYLDSSEHPLRISIISAGRPLIVPLWYEFDGQVFWCASPAHAKVVKLISKDGRCGFDLSDNAMPYRGVRGQGTAAIVSERGGDVLTRLESGQGDPKDVNLDEIFESINAAIAGSLGLESCMSFVCDDDQEREKRFSARHGIGKLFGRVRSRPLISSEKKDLFGICLNRKEDIFIQDTQSGKIASVIPEWVHYAGEVKSMIVLPAATDGKMFAIFIGTTMEDTLNDVEPEVLRQLRQLRGKLASLMRDREQGPAEK